MPAGKSPSGACTWEATAKDGCGGEEVLGEERTGRRRLAEVLTCPYTWMGWGCRAALRRVLSGFPAAGLAPRASP